MLVLACDFGSILGLCSGILVSRVVLALRVLGHVVLCWVARFQEDVCWWQDSRVVVWCVSVCRCVRTCVVGCAYTFLGCSYRQGCHGCTPLPDMPLLLFFLSL